VTVNPPSTSSSACPPPEHTSRLDAATDSPALTTASVAPAGHAPPAHGCRTSTASPKEFWCDWVGSDRTLTGETTMATTTTRIHVVESACSARRRFASRSSTDSAAPRGWPWCVHTCAMSCAPETRVSESSHAHCDGGRGVAHAVATGMLATARGCPSRPVHDHDYATPSAVTGRPRRAPERQNGGCGAHCCAQLGASQAAACPETPVRAWRSEGAGAASPVPRGPNDSRHAAARSQRGHGGGGACSTALSTAPPRAERARGEKNGRGACVHTGSA
jgi:hypothetical protein